MNIRKLFWPWGEIARLEVELDAARKVSGSRLLELDMAIRRNRAAQAVIDRLTADLAALKAAQQPRKPNGTFAAKVR